MGFSLCPEQGYEGRICEVPEEDGCSSMYIDYYALSSCIYMYSRFMIRLFDIHYSVTVLLFLHLGDLMRNIDWCLFSQVKNKP
jgi:hypothetical protein